jgi:transposase-like protein
MTCPFCDAERPELVSIFGSQLLLSQYRCRACGTYFEGLRQNESEVADGDPAAQS